MTKRFTPEEAIEVAQAAGLDTTQLEEQAAARRSGGALGEKIEALEAELQRRVPEPAASPEQQDRAVADAMLEAMNEQLTPWHTLGPDRG